MNSLSLHIINILPIVATAIIWLRFYIFTRKLDLLKILAIYFIFDGPMSLMLKKMVYVFSSTSTLSGEEITSNCLLVILILHFLVESKGQYSQEFMKLLKPQRKEKNELLIQKSNPMKDREELIELREILIAKLSIPFGKPKQNDEYAKFPNGVHKKIAKFLDVTPSAVTRMLKHPDHADSNVFTVSRYKKIIEKFDQKSSLVFENYFKLDDKNRTWTKYYSRYALMFMTLLLFVSCFWLINENRSLIKNSEQLETKSLSYSKKKQGILLDEKEDISDILSMHSKHVATDLSKMAFEEVYWLKNRYQSGDSISYKDKLKVAQKVYRDVRTYLTDFRNEIRKNDYWINYRIELADLMDILFPIESLFSIESEVLMNLEMPPSESLIFEHAAYSILIVIFEIPDDYLKFSYEVESRISNVQRIQSSILLKEAEKYLSQKESLQNATLIKK